MCEFVYQVVNDFYKVLKFFRILIDGDVVKVNLQVFIIIVIDDVVVFGIY